MASSTNNVKLGVCSILYKGVDLGYTKGGVDVDVTTDTHQTMVDQFGDSIVNEWITKRNIKVTCPLAETTLDNLIAIMPGSTMKSNGTAATGTITIATLPLTGETIIVNGATITFRTAASNAAEVTIGATTATAATNLAAVLNASVDSGITPATYGNATPSQVSVVYDIKSIAGNGFTLATGTAAAKVTMSGAVLTGGVAGTVVRVDVTNGIGVSLLATAGVLTLHPIANGASTAEDLTVPLASTAGAMKFSFKHNDERIFNTEFTGYPDPTTKLLFKLGDLLAV
jgi:hypothetical protein